MKKLFIALTLFLTCHALMAQSLIKPINGKSFFAEIQSVEDGVVKYQIGVSKMTMPTTDVALIEFSEGGVQYFHTEALQTVDPNNVGQPVYQKGNKVYIPFSSKEVARRSGALKLRELVSNGSIWEVADCKEEAHFILEFDYSEVGADGATVNMKDRKGNLIVQTPKVTKTSWDDAQKGEEIAKTQYEKYVSKIGTGELALGNGHLYLSGRKKGLVIRPEIAAGVSYGFSWNLYATINYQFSPYFSLGAGTGLSKPRFLSAIPLYVNARAYFSDSNWSPFFDVKVGYHFPLKSRSDYWDEYYGLLRIQKGFFINGTLGVQYKGFDFGIMGGLYGTKNDYYDEDYTYYDEGYNYKNIWLMVSVAYNFRLNKNK